MLYTVWYKRYNSFFWRKIEKIKADGVLIDMSSQVKSVYHHRWFITEDESRIEIPMQGMLFKFDTKRFLSIKKSMEIEAGQPIITK